MGLLYNSTFFFSYIPENHFVHYISFSEEELQLDEEDDDGNNQATVRIRGPGTDVIDSGDVGVLFLDQLDQTSDASERTDFTNFRSLLWRTMAQVPDRVEPRSRELSPLLLRFIRCVEKHGLSDQRRANKVPYNSCLWFLFTAVMSSTWPTCWWLPPKTFWREAALHQNRRWLRMMMLTWRMKKMSTSPNTPRGKCQEEQPPSKRISDPWTTLLSIDLLLKCVKTYFI